MSVQIQFIEPKDLKELIDQNQVCIIDVREESEFVQEHITQSRSFPLSTFMESAITTEKNVVFVCLKGIRAQAAAEKWGQYAHQTPKVLKGGLQEWKKMGYATDSNEQAHYLLTSQAKMWAGGIIFVSTLFSILFSSIFIFIPLLMGAVLFYDGLKQRCTISTLIKRFFKKGQ